MWQLQSRLMGSRWGGKQFCLPRLYHIRQIQFALWSYAPYRACLLRHRPPQQDLVAAASKSHHEMQASTCIFAVLLYACETWTLTKADWKRLESFHLRSQRRVLSGIKWSDFTTNAEVYTRSGLHSIQSIVRRRRLSLFGHVARMPDNVPAKAVLRVACDVRDGVPPYPNWHRSRGRPPITWLHQICSDCGLSAGDALNCAQDRAVWRTYATASSASRWRRRPLSCRDVSIRVKTKASSHAITERFVQIVRSGKSAMANQNH